MTTPNDLKDVLVDETKKSLRYDSEDQMTWKVVFVAFSVSLALWVCFFYALYVFFYQR